jgi:hypothetical protein
VNPDRTSVLSYLDEPDWLLARLTETPNAIHVLHGNVAVQVAFTRLDAALANILNSDASPHRLLLLVPRTAAGMLLPLATLTILGSRIGVDARAPRGVRAIPIKPARGLLYATGSRRLRDAFSKSEIRLAAFRQSLAGLPLFRLRTDRALAPITPPKFVVLAGLPRLVFYHYDRLNPRVGGLGIDLMLAELQETDGVLAAERLVSLLDDVRPTRAVAVVNEMYEDGIRRLRDDAGFLPIVVGQSDVGLLTGSSETQIVAFSVPYQRRTEKATIKWSVIPGESGVLLNDAHEYLVDLDRALGRARPDIVRHAWRYLNALAALPLPLALFERFVRSRNPYLCLDPLFHRLERAIFDGLVDEQRAIVAPRWPALIALLRAASESLRENNPKWQRLLDAVTSADASTIALSSQVALDAVMTELLVGFGWTHRDGDSVLVTVRDLAALNSGPRPLLHLALPSRRMRPLFWATTHPLTEIACYPHEARWGYVELRRELDLYKLRTAATNRVAADKLRTPVPPVDVLGTGRTLEEPSGLPAPGRDRARFEETVLSFSAAGPDDDLPDQSAPAEAQDASSVLLLTEAGEWISIPRDQEVCRVDRDTDSTEVIFADAIRAGDRLAVMGRNTANNLFQEAVRRTGHLTGVDLRPIEHWRLAIAGLREECRRSSVPLMISVIRAAGCERDPLTIRWWLSGITMAPASPDDLAIVLTVARDSQAQSWAPVVSREFESLRGFRRALGRRIRSRFGAMTRSEPPKDRLDMELDELLEEVSLMEVVDVRNSDDT